MDQAQAHDFAMPEAEEGGFVQAARRGDRVAFLALARWHWPAVSSVVRGLTPPDRAAGLTLDVFEHGWRGLHYLPEGQRFFAWIHRIAFNLCQSAPRAQTALADASGADAVAPAAEDAAARIDAAFAHLGVEHREAMILCLTCGLGAADIARVLEITPRTATQRLSGARAELHAGRAGWIPATGLRHFTLPQLCDYVGTDPASAPAFVRDHLGECADCREILTALESQDRILARRVARGPDPDGIEGFLIEIVERLATDPPPAGSDGSVSIPAPSAAGKGAALVSPRIAGPAPIRNFASTAEARRSSHPGAAIAGGALVMGVLLAVQFGPRMQPWLDDLGVRWGPPGRTPPATRVAGIERAPARAGSVPESVSPGTAVPPPGTPAADPPSPAPTAPPPRPATAQPGSTTAPPRSASAQPRPKAAAARTESTGRAAPSTGSPTGLLCGQVVDPDGRPVGGARVIVTGVELVLLTDRAGRFCLTASTGEHLLGVTRTGFEPLIQRVSVGARSAELTIVLDTRPAPPGPP